MEEVFWFICEIKWILHKISLADVDIPTVLLIIESVEFLNNVCVMKHIETTEIHIHEH